MRRWRGFMKPRISVLCPTRNRPASVGRLVRSGTYLADHGVEFVFYQDDDAPGSVPGEVAAQPWVTVLTGPRITLSDMWNQCWRHAITDVLMQCGDDIIFR